MPSNCCALAIASVISAAAFAAAPPGGPRDFDGDGFDDLAIGVPQEDQGGESFAGAVNVLYGSSDRLSATGDQFWHQNKSGVGDTCEQGDDFGWALAVGDFNGDGRSDLAIGVRLESLEEFTPTSHGVVQVLYGGDDGLNADADQLFSQETEGMSNSIQEFEDFGHALASADFNGDGFDDLAIGVPWEEIDGESAGAVHILFGSTDGLTTESEQFWHRGRSGIEGDLEGGFGWALGVGDFDGDGFDDLAIGVPYEFISGWKDAGSVHVLYGSSGGVRASNSQLWNKDVDGVLGTLGNNDAFGSALAGGDFNNDGFDDLAIGAPGEAIGGDDQSYAGAVNILYGSSDGLTAAGDQRWNQDTDGVDDAAEFNDNFGGALTAGDFNGDGYFDLAIGVWGESESGAVYVMRGSEDGLTTSRDDFITQDTDGMEDDAESGDLFGLALTIGDFNADGFDDLAIASPGEELAEDLAGLVHVVYGSSSGPDPSTSQMWHQDVAGVADAVEDWDLFGTALGY